MVAARIRVSAIEDPACEASYWIERGDLLMEFCETLDPSHTCGNVSLDVCDMAFTDTQLLILLFFLLMLF